ncbi:hypothetical protein RAAC3_TM7C00001G0204 [Candidatus Saccharibacteria bacterium RAAC3_TM7_1]|nr:hypothetical protein RAAC3_TM7C00001G0204 [Candidatus Saccharibacteria bacterium RAAC3_TM7_1]
MKLRGFTIVELLIVVVVIAIMAAITVVAYNGIQQRARDSIRTADLAFLEKSLKLYYADNGNYMNAASNCGNGNGDGYTHFDYDGTGVRIPIMDCFKNGGYITKNVEDPCFNKTCSGQTKFTYLKYTCGMGTFLYAHMEGIPLSDTATDGTCASGIDTTENVNYYIKF